MTTTSTTKRRRAPIRAAIISSDLDPGLLAQMTERLVAAGFRDVRTFADAAEVAPPGGKSGRQRLAPALRGRMLIVMDDPIGDRSGLDLHARLKAAPALKEPRFFLLLNDAADANVFAAWNAGIDCVLAKPFVMDEFATFAGRLYEALASEPAGPAAEAPAP